MKNIIPKLPLALLLLAAAPLLAQTKPAAPPPAPGAGGFNFDPAAIRKRIMKTMKDAADCSDDEWKVIEPKLIKIILLKMDTGEYALGGARGARIRTFIRSILDPNALPSAVDQRLDELQKMIDEKETSDDFYKNKIAQLRKAREKAAGELKTAEADLIAILTVRQEAALVQLGILE